MVSTKRSRKETANEVRAAIVEHWRTHTDREIGGMLAVSPTTVGKYRRQLEDEGAILPRIESGQPIEACLRDVSTSAVEPSPENDKLYEPIREDDPAFLALVDDVRKNGILERIVVSADGFIISGHRRHAAAGYLHLKRIPVRITPEVSRARDTDKFAQLLPSYNQQRVKTTSEAVREGIALMDGPSWQRVCDYRSEVGMIDCTQVIKLTGTKKRSRITQKQSLRRAIIDTVLEHKADWPMSDRRIFYLLLNSPGLLRNDVKEIPFANTPECYNDLTNMLTRMRLDDSIPFDCIADETRPVVEWGTHRSVGTFADEQLEGLFSGYWRDLQQSQPNQIELLVEKNTAAGSLKEVTAKYTVPMTSGRGYSSLPPRKAMVDRFRESGRERLIVVVASDFDPEGEDIPNAFGVSLRDDFGIDADSLVVVKAALTAEQAQTMGLHEGQLAKEDLARYKRFVEKHGNRCWELEAIPTQTLRQIVEGAIRSVLDLEAFEGELQKQEQEQDELDEHRRRIRQALADVQLN